MEVKRKLTVSLSTWFCLPDQGMIDMEILCRATAFIVKSRSKGYQNKLHVVTASRNVAPWKYPKTFPDEWLQFISEKNTHYTIEIRHPDGIFMTQTELLPVSFHHSSRDLAVLHLENDPDGVKLFQRLGLDPHSLSTRPLVPGDSVMFEGHSIVAASSSSKTSNFGDDDTSATEEGKLDLRLPVPTVVPGTFVSQSMYQRFARSNHTINHGMSGGPVTCSKGSGTSHATRGKKAVEVGAAPAAKGEVCGLLEGVVPEDSEEVERRGMAAIVDSATIAEFLQDIEEGMEHTLSQGHSYLKGGEAAQHVGSDQDPVKMSLESIMNESNKK